ncbi:DUF192 domain-containing protein [Altererythrobacter sp. Root672]|uniref:DUF192 domain-containing protein n=1 Tax=Altererythrobacter sp. Root672 TaxID=1736584 RepID=UPI000A5BEC3C|nr:DUF192 domain-containing protein [Altererythrobacter sp. Root672]
MRALLLAILILVPACSPQAAGGATSSAAATATTAVHPTSGLEVIPLKITTPTGKAHAFRAEVARTPQEQAKGLMFRTEMGADEGMLFPYARPQLLSFWMKNTVLSLDLIFIGEDRRIINIAANATPYSETPIPSDGPGIAVLELNGGRAAQLGLVPGSKVEW